MMPLHDHSCCHLLTECRFMSAPDSVKGADCVIILNISSTENMFRNDDTVNCPFLCIK